MTDHTTPDALRALADGITVGDLIDHNLRAAADRIEALERENEDQRLRILSQERAMRRRERVIEALTDERDDE